MSCTSGERKMQFETFENDLVSCKTDEEVLFVLAADKGGCNTDQCHIRQHNIAN